MVTLSLILDPILNTSILFCFVFYKVCTNLHSHQQRVEILFSLHPQSSLVSLKIRFI